MLLGSKALRGKPLTFSTDPISPRVDVRVFLIKPMAALAMRFLRRRLVCLPVYLPALGENSFAISPPPILHRRFLTFFTLSPALTRVDGILWCVFMAIDAMGFFPIEARGGFTVEQVLPMGQCSEVVGIDACAIMTTVRDFSPLWDWANKVLIRPAMGVNGTFSSARRKQSVPIRKPVSDPELTGILSETDEFQEARDWRLAFWSFRHNHAQLSSRPMQGA
jgi:hypothetical protein